MNKILKCLASLEGETVLKVEDFMEGVCIKTSEGFLFLKSIMDYGDPKIEVETDRGEIMSDWSWADLIAIGFTTQEELDASSQARARLWEIQERNRYEALKRKFEGKK